ncbi:hypothetical protein [Acidianus sp. RZ1]|uniref:hypothetical protein n=1 Tax=Acidianus sp. RZ1 TaxID=1540082 RepID=UPI00149155B9|nr:hypothetical protein [Acidianus sp. RZ1]NON63625.1 hypothetical protein [Acidianus sp. RZ1]
MEVKEDFLKSRPTCYVKLLNIPIPCGSAYIVSSKFKDLLNNENFRSQVEVIDSLMSLIDVQVDTLVQILKDQFSDAEVDINSLAYSIYYIIEEGGEMVIGEKLRFRDKIIAQGNFSSISRIVRRIESTRNDPNIVSLCDEIKHLSESLWTHYDKNLRRSLNES